MRSRQSFKTAWNAQLIALPTCVIGRSFGIRRVAAGSLVKSFRVDLVEHAAIGEVGLLSLGPTAKGLVDREQLQLAKVVCVLGGDDLVARPVEMRRRDLLAFIAVEVFEVSFRDLSRTLLLHRLIHPSDGWFGQNAERRGNDLELV